MSTLPPVVLLMLLLVGTSSIAQACPPPGESEGRCIELTAERTNGVSEVQISPGQPTTFSFDSDVRADEMTLENREHFKVAPGTRLITLEPSERMRGEKPSTLTVCFADGAAPACTTFRLVIHPAIGERRVELLRNQRPVESLQAELKKSYEENAKLRAEMERLRAERDRPDGLTGLVASGMMGEAGIPAQSIIRHITLRKSNTLRPRMVAAVRAPGRVAITLELENPEGAKPWIPQGAKLVGSKGELLNVTLWPAEPIPSGKRRHVWIEAMAPDVRPGGTFILKIWEADGQRTFVIGNVTFPVLPERPELSDEPRPG